jgi:RES domain-containing protein
MKLWRISNRVSLGGEGGLRYTARWHSAGSPIVYLAESPAGAMLEVLVHLELDEDSLPGQYKLLQIEVPANVTIDTVEPPSDADWRTNLDLSRRLGDEWLRSRSSVLARVPSAVLSHTWNVLLNPLHSEANRLSVIETTSAAFDPRLLRHLRR